VPAVAARPRVAGSLAGWRATSRRGARRGQVTRSTYSANDDIKNADRVIADLTEVDLSQVSTVALSAVGLNA